MGRFRSYEETQQKCGDETINQRKRNRESKVDSQVYTEEKIPEMKESVDANTHSEIYREK